MCNKTFLCSVLISCYLLCSISVLTISLCTAMSLVFFSFRSPLLAVSCLSLDKFIF